MIRASHLIRVAFAALVAAVAFGSPQAGHAATTAASCLGTLPVACAYDIDGGRLGCRSDGTAAFRPDCAPDLRPRYSEKQIFASLCTSPLCLGPARPAAKRTREVLLGAALPLLLGSLALIGAMGIRPRA